MISSEKDDKRKEKFQLLNNETLDKNVIIDVLNQEQKQKIQEERNYEPIDDLRKEEEEKQRIIEENKKIEEQRKVVEEEKKE